MTRTSKIVWSNWWFFLSFDSCILICGFFSLLLSCPGYICRSFPWTFYSPLRIFKSFPNFLINYIISSISSIVLQMQSLFHSLNQYWYHFHLSISEDSSLSDVWLKQVSYSFFAHSKNSAIRCSTFLPFFCHFPGQISHPDCISWRNLIVNFTVWAGPWMQYSISQDSQKFKLLALRKLRQTHFLEAPLKPNITSHTHT